MKKKIRLSRNGEHKQNGFQDWGRGKYREDEEGDTLRIVGWSEEEDQRETETIGFACVRRVR